LIKIHLIAMIPAATDGAQSKNPDGFFFSQSSLMRQLSPAADQSPHKENGNLPCRASENP
jgi:hypothetical protein